MATLFDRLALGPTRLLDTRHMKIYAIIAYVIAVILLAGLIHVVNVCVSRGTYDAQYGRIEGNQNNRPMGYRP